MDPDSVARHTGGDFYGSTSQGSANEQQPDTEKTSLAPKTKPWKIRTIQSDMKPIEVKTTHTIAAIFLGEHSTTEAFLFNIGVKSQASALSLWGVWCVGAVVGLLAVARAIPLDFVWASLLMLPLPIITVLLLSVDLVKQIVVSMDLYIIYILQVAFFVDGIYYCRGDIRRVFWYCYLPTLLASGLVDGYAAKFRPLFAKLFFSSAITILLVWNFLLMFKWEVFGAVHKLANMSFILHHMSDQLTLVVFYGRHIWCSIFRPDYFVMIKADVLTGRQLFERKTEFDLAFQKVERKPSQLFDP